MAKIKKQHMSVHWQEIAHGDGDAATNASLKEKATLVGRVGMMMLSVGTGAWRVRSYMNAVSRRLVTSDLLFFPFSIKAYQALFIFSLLLLLHFCSRFAKRTALFKACIVGHIVNH